MDTQTTLAEHADKYDQVIEATFKGDLETVHDHFHILGPYQFSAMHGLLVNGSGEETAIRFMTAYNQLHPGTY